MSYLKEHEEHKAKQERVSYSVVYMTSNLGSIQIEICDFCGYMYILCEHEHNTWNEEGTILTCNLCGSEGT